MSFQEIDDYDDKNFTRPAQAIRMCYNRTENVSLISRFTIKYSCVKRIQYCQRLFFFGFNIGIMKLTPTVTKRIVTTVKCQIFLCNISQASDLSSKRKNK